MPAYRAVFTVTVETNPDGDYYFDHADFVRHVGPWIEGGLDDRDNIRTVTITEQPADQTALRDRIRRAICEASGFAWDSDMLEPDEYGEVADAVLAVLPAPADRAAILQEAATRLEADMERFFAEWPDEPRNSPYALGRKDAATELRRVADEAQQPETQAEIPAAVLHEDPTRIDRLRPEFFEHASVESIDVQIQRAQRQQRQWGNRAQTLTILRQARVMQKELGEWPAAAQQPKEADNPRTVCVCGHIRGEHLVVSGRLLCDACDPDSTSNLVCKEFDAL
jgi:hypothetical protein